MKNDSKLALLAQELAESQWYDSVEKVGLEMLLLDKTHFLVPREEWNAKRHIELLLKSIQRALVKTESDLAASQSSKPSKSMVEAAAREFKRVTHMELSREDTGRYATKYIIKRVLLAAWKARNDEVKK